MSARDPYAMHAMLLVFGGDRSDISARLLEIAEDIERSEESRIAEDVCIVRKSTLDVGGNEEANACRMYGVFRAESDDPSPIAMFKDRDAAYRFAGCASDLCVMRSDVVMSSFNHVDQNADPHASEAP